MTTGPVRWGVLGASHFALKTKIPALHAARRGKVVALASRRPEKAAPAVEMIPDLLVLNDYDTLLARPDIDAIYIPLPNALHAEWAERTMRAEKHVLVEKPLAMDVQEIDQLITTASETDRLCAEALMVCHHPQWHAIRDMLADGVIGPLRHIEGHFTYYKRDATNIRSDASLGGGALRDIGVYPLATARWALGREPDIQFVDMQMEDGVDIRTRVAALFGDVSFDFFCSMRMLRRQGMRFFGERGTITVPAPFNPGIYGEGRIELQLKGGETRILAFPQEDQYILQAEAFHRAVNEATHYPCSLEFSRGNQKAVDRIFALAVSASA